MQVFQKRLAPDVWLREAITLDFVGRKFFSPVRLRCIENCSGFRKVEGMHPSALSVSSASK
jgi:hypothetical protein